MNETVEVVQAAVDGSPDEKTALLLGPVLKPLYAAYAALKQALRGSSNVITAADVEAVFADHSFTRQLLPERESARIGF